MNAQEIAYALDGTEYPLRISPDISKAAKAAGLVIVYGASDDLMEFDGAVNDELGAYDGTTAYLTPAGLLQNDCNNDECPHFEKLKDGAATIEALWASEGDYSWTYRTNIPHATFDIKEDGGPYCRGIVFALKDAGQVTTNTL